MSIPSNIEELAHKVRTEIYGRDVREALATSMEATAEVAEWSRQVAQQIIDGEFDEAELLTEIERKLNELEQEYAPELTNIKNEVEDARGNESTLGNRLDGFSSQLAQTEQELAGLEDKKMDKNTTDISVQQINKNKGKLDETYMSDEFLQQVAGNTPIHAVPADDSLTTRKYVDRSVTRGKLNIPDDLLLPKTYNFERGNMGSGGPTEFGLNDRMHSELFSVKTGDTIKSINDVEFSIWERVDDNEYIQRTQWQTEYISFSDIEVRLSARFNDNRNLVELGEQVKNSIYHINENTGVTLKEFNAFKDIFKSNDFDFVIGFFDSQGNETDASNRIKMPSFYTTDKSLKITLDSNDAEFAILFEGDTNFVWRDADVEVPANSAFRIGMRYKDNRRINNNDELEELASYLRVITDGSYVKFKDLLNIFDDTVQKTVYVSTEGSDNNNGSSSSPFKTLKRALQVNPSKVYIKEGVYYEGDIVINKNIEIIGYNNTQSNNVIAEFRGSDLLDAWESYNGIYRQQYTGNDLFHKVFITKELPPETDGNRPSYNATVWEVTNNLKDDYKLKPVLTLSECEGEEGTFYYDGTYLYINPTDITNEFHAVKEEVGITFRDSNVKLANISFNFYQNTPIDLNSNYYVDVQNSEANYSVTSNGFSIDRTNGKFTNCKAKKNRNDGFNLHYFGDTEFINCEGLYNYDDGISHHENCNGVIFGGKWIGNGKGGIAPAHGCQVNWYNCLLKDNGYGAFHQNASGVSNISSNNLYINNNVAIRNDNAELTSFNDVFVDNNTKFSGNAVNSINEY